MTATLIGTEDLGQFTIGAGQTYGLTIPSGTTAILVTTHGDNQYDYAVDMDVGGVALAHLGGAPAGNQVSAWHKGVVGISGRTDDTLTFDISNFTWHLVAYYFGGAALEFGNVANAACSTCNGNFLKTSVAVPAAAVDGTCIVVCAMAGYGATGSARPTSPPSTVAWSGALAADWGSSHSATLTATTDVGIQNGGLTFWQVISNITLYDTNPSVVGVPIGMEMGFNAGTVAEVADKTIGGARLRALEMGLNAGRLSAEAPRQVALTGEDIETPEMTAGGTEGQVLTQHANRRPTWEDGGASLTVKEADGAPSVASVDTIVVNDGSLTDDGSGQITLDNTGPAGPAGPTGPAASPGLAVYLYENFK